MRLELTKKTDLAFQALAAIGENDDRRMTGADLAARLGITTHYLPHVMAPLTRLGWVESTSGPKGGYNLAIDPHEISLLSLVEAVEGPIDDSRCLHLGPIHEGARACALHRPWTRAREALIHELAAANVGDAIDERGAAMERDDELATT